MTYQEGLDELTGYLIENYRLTPDGHCPACAAAIPGRWSPSFEGQITSRPFLPHKNTTLFAIREN